MNRDEIIAMAIEASSMARLPWNGQWIFRSKKEFMAFSALVAEKAAAKEREACDKWRQAIDHEMVVAHLGVAKPEDDPSALLRKIIQWHVDVALDPAVSAGARALIEEEREACAQVCDGFDTGRRLTTDFKAADMATAIRARSAE